MNTRYDEERAKVLTEEEKYNFEGVTIDENGFEEPFSEGEVNEYERNYGATPRMKVYTVSSRSSFWLKLAIFGVLLGIVCIALFFGGFLLLGAVAVAFIGAILSWIRRLF